MLKPFSFRGGAVLTAVVALASLPGIAGCAGSAPPRAVVQTTRAVRFHLAWGERSRHVEAPNSAQSVRVRFIAASTDGRTVTLVADRPAGPQGVLQEIVVDESVRVGSQEVVIQFYSERGATGTIVGVARSFVTIQPDGTGADDIAVTGLVHSVSLPTNPTLVIDEEKELPVTARDRDGKVLALSPGSVFLALRGGGDAIEILPDGRLRAKAAGTAAVVALVDGVESAPTQIVVSPDSTLPRFTLIWAARSRYVNSVASARSCRVTLVGASLTGGDVVVPVVNRRAAPEAYFQVVTIAEPVATGTRTFTAQFFADPDGQGALVGVASGQLPVNADGSGLDTFTLNTASTITSTEVVSGQVLAVGSSQLLNFTARNKDGQIVAVSPGSAFWTQAEGNAIQVLQDGTAQAAAAGEIKVRVTVDGTISEPAIIRASDSIGGINVDIL